MKNLFKIFLVVLTTTMFLSCEDDEKNQITDTIEAPFAYFGEISSPVINVTDLEGSAFEAEVVAPFGNITSYDIRVNRNNAEDADGNLVYVPLTNITEQFPLDLRISATDLAAAFGITLADLQAGDQYNFLATTTGSDGITIDPGDGTQFLGAITNPGLEQALSFTTFISCPFNQSDAIGTYTKQTDAFGLAASTFEVIAGPDENSLTVVDLFSAGANFDIQINPDTGIATIARQPVAPSFFGYSGGNINTSGTSFVFSCTGAFVFNLQYTVDLGSFGSFDFSAVKN